MSSLEPRSIPDTSQAILILSKNELSRIAANRIPASPVQAKGREEIRNASKKMTENWNNTISGMAKERLKHAKLKADAIEAERREIDDVEGRYQELRRQYVLDVAKKRMYMQTDRVKRLHAAKNLAEVLKEREEQLATKEKVKHVFDDFYQAYDRSVLDDVEKFHEEERLRIAADRESCKKVNTQLQKQRDAFKAKRNQEKEESVQATMMLKDLAEKIADEDRQEVQDEKQHRMEFRRVLDEELSKKEHIKNTLLKLEEAEDKRIEIFNEAKLKMKRMNIEKQKDVQRLQDEQLKELSKKLKDQGKAVLRKEEKNLKRAIREKELKEKKEAEEKQKARRRALEEIDKYTKKSVADKKQAKHDEKAMRLKEGIQLTELYERLTKEEEQKKKQKTLAIKQTKHINLHQIAKHEDKKAEEIKTEFEEQARHLAGLYQEEETFQKYAKELIKECEDKGLDTYPLKVVTMPGIECGKGPIRAERGNIRPKYYASVTNPDELHYVKPKEKASFSATKLRLGFCD